MKSSKRSTKAKESLRSGGEMDMGRATDAVEQILGYRFRNPKLLVDALTHPSYAGATSYERLEFLGDYAVGIVLTIHIFLSHPHLDPGDLSVLRSANISTEKLARVAVRHDLFRYLRHNVPLLEDKVREFERAIRYEFDELVYGTAIKAPKVLADIVESIVAAVFMDCGFDNTKLWMVFRGLLEPIVTMETLQQHPVTMLYEFCQKQGKHVEIKLRDKGSKKIANVFVDGKLLGLGKSEQKEIAKLIAAKESLQKLMDSELSDVEMNVIEITGVEKIEDAKKRLNELCSKSHWPNPVYRVEKESGPPHNRKFVCSVQVDTLEGGKYTASGNVKRRIKDAESSAASMMLNGLPIR